MKRTKNIITDKVDSKRLIVRLPSISTRIATRYNITCDETTVDPFDQNNTR